MLEVLLACSDLAWERVVHLRRYSQDAVGQQRGSAP
jgi:hypothetical protein